MFEVVLPHALFPSAVGKVEGALSMLLVVAPFSDVSVSVGPGVRALAYARKSEQANMPDCVEPIDNSKGLRSPYRAWCPLATRPRSGRRWPIP